MPHPPGCSGTAGTQTRTHPAGPSTRGSCLSWLTPMGTAATMRMVQMGRLSFREGSDPPRSTSSSRCLRWGGSPGAGGVISRRKELGFLPTPPDSDSLGEPAVPHKGLDCYLDSLFDPVLSYGDAVGTQGASEGHSGARAQEPLAAMPWGGWRGALGGGGSVRCPLPWSLGSMALGRSLEPSAPQDLEKPTAIAYRMKGGGQPGRDGSSSTEDPPRRPPEPKPKPSQCLLQVGFRVGLGGAPRCSGQLQP